MNGRDLKCVTTDGGRNMSGQRTGLVGQIIKALANAACSKPMIIHCAIHQQALCAKYLNMSTVLEPPVKTVNFIRSHALNHRQFRSFLSEIEAEHEDLPYYTAVRWLSCGKVLERFFALRVEIEVFLNEKNHPLAVLSSGDW